MSNQADALSSNPLFSIIIPLEFHRGQWERCWQNWNAQTIDKSAYETILVVPPDFRSEIPLNELFADCLEFSSSSHDIDLCAAGAARARGKYLIFTEAHCWPEPDVLEQCLEAIDTNPHWAGFSCLSLPITHNRLSEAEADMYMADIEYAMQVHPWRKILDQCFVTSREAYESCGGFKVGLGHFAEWLLAASYYQRGYKLGYYPKAKFHHYYSGSLSELQAFTLDFVVGEISYFDRKHGAADGDLFEIPQEWICQGNFDRDTARAVLHIAVQRLWPPGRSCRHLPRTVIQIGRWVSPAIFGDRLVRIFAAAAAGYARIALQLTVAFGSQKLLNHQFAKYIARLIRTQRLATIGMQRRAGRGSMPPGYVGFDLEVFAPSPTGFYPLEQSQGSRFRWSETAASVIVSTYAGPQKILIDCLPVRDLSDVRSDFRFYIDGVLIPSNDVSVKADRISIDLDMEQPQMVGLGWTCWPFIAKADYRQLGLPIKRIELIPGRSTEAATSIGDASQAVTLRI